MVSTASGSRCSGIWSNSSISRTGRARYAGPPGPGSQPTAPNAAGCPMSVDTLHPPSASRAASVKRPVASARRRRVLQEVPLPDGAASRSRQGPRSASSRWTFRAGRSQTGCRSATAGPTSRPRRCPGHRRPEHPSRQHGPFALPLGGAAGQLAGPRRRRAPTVSDVRPAPSRLILSGEVVLASVHQRLRVPGRHPGRRPREGRPRPAPARRCGRSSPSHSGTPVASMASAVRPASGPADARPAGADSGRRLLRPGQVAAAVQGLGQGELEPVRSSRRSPPRRPTALPVQAHGLLERERLRCHVGRRRTRRYRSVRSPGSDASTRCRATSARCRSSCPS